MLLDNVSQVGEVDTVFDNIGSAYWLSVLSAGKRRIPPQNPNINRKAVADPLNLRSKVQIVVRATTNNSLLGKNQQQSGTFPATCS